MARELSEVAAQLDVIKTWFSPGSARYKVVADLADEVAEHAGGRKEPEAGDPNTPTPGPGIRGAHPQAPVEVESVGELEIDEDSPGFRP